MLRKILLVISIIVSLAFVLGDIERTWAGDPEDQPSPSTEVGKQRVEGIIYRGRTRNALDTPGNKTATHVRPEELINVEVVYCSNRSFGYFVGNKICFRYRIVAPQNFSLDFSGLPKVGYETRDKLFKVLDRTIEETLQDSKKLWVVTYVIQNFVVLDAQDEVPFGPLEVYWTIEKDEAGYYVNFRKFSLPPVMVLISPISKPSSTLKDLQPPHMPLPEDRWALIKSLFVLTVFFVTLGAVLLFKIVLAERIRKDLSSFHKALQKIYKLEKVSDPKLIDETMGLFRGAVVEYFKLPSYVEPEGVWQRLEHESKWREFALPASDLFKETKAVLFQRMPAVDDLFGRLKSLLEKMERREIDEAR